MEAGSTFSLHICHVLVGAARLVCTLVLEIIEQNVALVPYDCTSLVLDSQNLYS